jgi:hypothetical protein
MAWLVPFMFSDRMPRNAQILWVDLKSDESCYSARQRSYCCVSDSEKWVHHLEFSAAAVKANAPLRQFGRKSGWMGPIGVSVKNGLIRNKPIIPTASLVLTVGMSPSSDVAFIGVVHTDSAAVERNVACLREMENVFMAVVQKTAGGYRFEMSGRYFFAFSRRHCD